MTRGMGIEQMKRGGDESEKRGKGGAGSDALSHLGFVGDMCEIE